MKYIPSNITPEIYFYYFCEDENAKRFFEEYVGKIPNNVDDLKIRIMELKNGLDELEDEIFSLLDEIEKFK